MDVQTTLTQHFAEIIDMARLAPSVHNTQPWVVALRGNGVEVKVDKRHALSEGDPTGRQTMISLGVFCEALVVGAAMFGLVIVDIELQAKHATVSFGISKRTLTLSKSRQSTTLLHKRSSDRSVYRPTTISQANIESIEKTDIGLAASIRVVTDKSILQQIAQLTGQGIGLALSNPSFRKELSHYLLLPGSRKKRGINIRSLYINPLLAYLQPLLMRAGIGLHKEAQLERRRWLSASGVIVILADGDLSRFWLESGRAYLRASLAAEALGFSQATSAAIVEASTYHEDIEALLGTHKRILGLIRIGKGSSVRYPSPRLSPEELIT